MPFPPLSPSIFFEDDELRALVVEFSERLRADALMRPALDRLIGNQWFEAELGAEAFLRAVLFMVEVPVVDINWLARAVEVFGPEEIERLCDVMLDCSFAVFPLQAAAALVEVAERLAETMQPLVAASGTKKTQRMINAQSMLQAGGLMNRFRTRCFHSE